MKTRREKERTRRNAAMILLLPLILELAGCSINGSAAPTQLLDLGPSTDDASTLGRSPWLLDSNNSSTSSGNALRGEPVAISFSGAQLLAETDVIWRVRGSAIAGSYATYRWSTPPMQLVRQRIIEKLSTTRAIVEDGADPFAPLLQISLTHFEQVYAPDGNSSIGQVSLRAVLLRHHRVVDSILLSKTAPAPTPDALGGVTALRAATDAATVDLSAWLKQHLISSGPASPCRSVPDVCP